LTFTGQEPFPGEQILIPPGALADARVDPSLDHLVSGYVETRLLVAGYGIAPWDDRPADALGLDPSTLRGSAEGLSIRTTRGVETPHERS
jgi:hypothetical protein